MFVNRVSSLFVCFGAIFATVRAAFTQLNLPSFGLKQKETFNKKKRYYAIASDTEKHFAKINMSEGLWMLKHNLFFCP